MDRRRESRFAGAVLCSALLFASAPSVAEACSCVPQTLESAWFDSTDTFVGEVLQVRVGQRQVYRVEVKHTFKGCLVSGDVVTIETPLDSAACGETLTVGSEVLLTATESLTAPLPGTYAISLCGYNRLTSVLTADERAMFLPPDTDSAADSEEVTGVSQAEMGRRLDEAARQRPVWWIVGTSLAFEGVIIAIGAVIFVRRDF